jgi:secreted trypsin-like serine protease
VTQPILGGTVSQTLVPLTAGQVASIARLRPVDAGTDSQICTATYIAADVALTAAHCLVWDGYALEGASVRSVVAVHEHPSLDLGLLEVSPSCSALSHEPLQLATSAQLPNLEDEVVIAGYGRTEDGSYGDLLFAVEPVVELTAGALRVDGQGQSGACDGDSGGPLLVQDTEGSPRLVGTLSAGDASCLGIDEYVLVSAAADWAPLRAVFDSP